MKQLAVTIGEGDTELKAFVTENAENNLTLRAALINRGEGIVRLEYAAALLLNETHALYKGLTAYIVVVEGEEVLHVQTHEAVLYVPGLKGVPEPGPAPTPTPTPAPASTPNSAEGTHEDTGTPAEHYYGLGAILVIVAAGTLLAIRKMKS